MFCVRCVDDLKSTNGGAFFLSGRLVSWLRKKKDSVSLSIVEVEYFVVASYCTQVLWMKKTLKEIGVMCDEPISIFCDKKVQ